MQAIQHVGSRLIEGCQKVYRSPLIAKICWVAAQILKAGVVAAFSYSLPALSLLISLGLLFVCRYEAKTPTETEKWMNHQYHLYDKINLITLAACQELSLPIFVLLGSCSLAGWYFDVKLEKSTLPAHSDQIKEMSCIPSQ